MITFIGNHLPLLMVLTLGLLLFSGLPVAVVLAGVGLAFGVIGYAFGQVRLEDFTIVFYRVYGTLANPDDLQYAAVPALILMGAVLHASGIAGDLLAAVERLMPRIPGNLAIAATLMAVILAPTAGVIAASVGALALFALPVMLERGYRPAYAAGSIAAAGTLGVGLPPGVLLFFVAEAMNVHLPGLFAAMLGPALLLLALHLAYHVLEGRRHRRTASAAVAAKRAPAGTSTSSSLIGAIAGLASLAFIVVSILAGWATLSEAASLGALGAVLLTFLLRRLTLAMLKTAIVDTMSATSMIFFIFVGATLFSALFRQLGGIKATIDLVNDLGLGSAGTLATIMVVIFCLGFVIDWLEIVLVTMPIFEPVLRALDFGGHVGQPFLAPYWIAILLTLNLQSSFLTPPFGFALFLLKGAAPPGLRMTDIYRGIVPFVAMQVLVMLCVAAFPWIATWLPNQLFDLRIGRGPKFQE